MLKFSEFVHSLFVPTSLNITRVSPLRGKSLFVLDPNRELAVLLNPEFVVASPLDEQRFDAPRRRLKQLVSTHVNLTGSEWGRKVLQAWEMMLPQWVYVIPKNQSASNEVSQQDVPLRLVRA